MTFAGPSPDLPPVERLRPGLSVVPVPLPNNSLRYVFVYVFESDRGVYLVDAGWNTDDAYAALVRTATSSVGAPMRRSIAPTRSSRSVGST